MIAVPMSRNWRQPKRERGLVHRVGFSTRTGRIDNSRTLCGRAIREWWERREDSAGDPTCPDCMNYEDGR